LGFVSAKMTPLRTCRVYGT